MLSGWMDKQGKRDKKHLQQAKKVFEKMEHKDPVVAAYEKATGKKYELTNPYDVSAFKKIFLLKWLQKRKKQLLMLNQNRKRRRILKNKHKRKLKK